MSGQDALEVTSFAMTAGLMLFAVGFGCLVLGYMLGRKDSKDDS